MKTKFELKSFLTNNREVVIAKFEALKERGIDVDEAFGILVDPEDPGEFVYVSDGFIRGLKEDENEDGEWHHYFRKDADGFLEAGKFKF